jgi:hypothetical protein
VGERGEPGVLGVGWGRLGVCRPAGRKEGPSSSASSETTPHPSNKCRLSPAGAQGGRRRAEKEEKKSASIDRPTTTIYSRRASLFPDGVRLLFGVVGWCERTSVSTGCTSAQCVKAASTGVAESTSHAVSYGGGG